MTRAIVLAVIGCGSSSAPADDCKLVLGDLPHAAANVTKRYPGDPVKVAETIERCIAPEGDDCERIAKIVTAIPVMMPGANKPGGDYVALCRTAPPDGDPAGRSADRHARDLARRRYSQARGL